MGNNATVPSVLIVAVVAAPAPFLLTGHIGFNFNLTGRRRKGRRTHAGKA